MAGLILMIAFGASAQTVTLQRSDGAVQLSGKLLGFDGEVYRIETRFGEMQLNALGVTCVGHACPDPGQYAADISVVGSSEVVQHVLPGIIEEFAFRNGHDSLRRQHSDLSWTYFISDSSRIPVARLQARAVSADEGLAAINADQVDFTILPSRQIGPTSGDVRQLLLVDGIVFIVSPMNPIAQLSVAELHDIFSGTTTNWTDLGGFDGPIHILQPTSDSDLFAAYHRVVFAKDNALLHVKGREFSDLQNLSDAVAKDAFAIGVVSFGAIRNAKPLALSSTCGMAHRPSAFSLHAGDYPFGRDTYLFKPSRRLPVFARNFLTYLDSDAAQGAIADLGFVGQRPLKLSLGNQQNRLADAIASAGDGVDLAALQSFVKAFSGATRLSTTFRFEDNSTIMDARSRRNIRFLAEMIETGSFDGKKLIFAGFSDSQGGASGNRKISRKRAAQVAGLVKSDAGRADLSELTIQTIGLGEVSPLACNDTESGRHINRRVEVWVK